MGRPKKRRHVEQTQSEEPSQPWPSNRPAAPGLTQRQHSSSATPSLGRPSPYYEPLEVMPALDVSLNMFPQSHTLVDPFLDMDLSLFDSPEVRDFNLSTSDGTQPEKQLTRGTVHRIFEVIGNFIFSRGLSDVENSAKPKASPAASAIIPAADRNAKVFPNSACPCLSSIYLALDSLTSVTDNLLVSINITRKASKAAHDVISCPVCSLPLTEDPLAIPPIQSTQNMFLLSALLSSLSNAYARLLEVVDTTVAEATSESRNIHFSFRGLGGVWSQIACSDAGNCMLSRGINETDLPPQLWRLAMRAVLRYEIYGFCPTPDDPMCAGAGAAQTDHLGLARAVERLEDRSVTRHERLDRLYEQGLEAPSMSPHTPMKAMKEGEKPQCLRIIECARLALDKLVIA